MEKKQIQGYFTVEASILFPMVLLVQILLIYLALYCFDRCVLEQCAFEAAVRGSDCMIQDNEQAYIITKEAAEYLIEDRLFSVRNLQSHVTVSGTTVSVIYECNFIMPFSTWMAQLLTDRNFYLYTKKEMSRIHQVKSVRLAEFGKEIINNGNQ